MARVGGPLFSMSASGTVGKAITYGTWKGRAWARAHFTPENPKTAKQTNIRTAMKLLVALWKTEGDAYKLEWDAYASPFAMSGFNKYVSRGMDAYVLDPGIEVLPTSVTNDTHAPGTETWTWNAP